MIFACPVALCELARVLALGEIGRLDEARRARERAITLALEHGELHTAVSSLASPGMLPLQLVPVDRCLADAERALALSDVLGGGFPRSIALVSRALAEGVLEQPGRAVECLTESLAICSTRNVGLFIQPVFLRLLAYAHLCGGNTATAVSIAHEAVEIASAGGLRALEIGAQEMLARAQSMAGTTTAREHPSAQCRSPTRSARAPGSRSWS